MQYILAHDLGTTGNKATLYDVDGQLRGSAFYAYSTTYPETGWAEQNPEDWWRAVCSATRQLLLETGVQKSEVACVTFSGQMMGAVALDSHARPLRPCIIWADQRAVSQADWLGERIDHELVYRITGHRLSPAYALAKILWIRDHQPEIYAATHKFVFPKEAIIARLTAQYATEPSDASGGQAYDLVKNCWSEDILQAAQVDEDKLPRIVRSTDIIGGVLAEVADEVGLAAGTPVVMGGGDGACAAVGAGSVRDHVAYSYVGSSSWIATASRSPIYDPTMRTFNFGHVVPGLFMPTGTMQTAGAAYQWARDQLSSVERHAAEQLGVNAYTLMNAVAETSPAGANRLLFLPYLLGERSPRWNPHARAAFIGLTMRHTRADMLRAVMEGVAFNLRVILDAFRQQGAAIESIRAIGGGVSGRFWAQLMADIYGLPLHRLTFLEEATSMGAAIVGGVGVGLYPSFDSEHMNPIAETLHPNHANHAVYDELYRAFEAAYTGLEPVFELLKN